MCGGATLLLECGYVPRLERLPVKLVFGLERSRIADHAQKLLIAQVKFDWKNPHNVIPLGIPAHAVRYPVVCDECGMTFWANDPYAWHRKCSAKKNATGFS